MSTVDWGARAASLDWNVRPFIGGRYVVSKSEEVCENVNPARETSLCQFRAGSGTDIDHAVSVCRERFDDKSWRDLSATRRADSLLRLATILEARQSHLALLDSLEMGKPISAALLDAGVIAPALLRACAG